MIRSFLLSVLALSLPLAARAANDEPRVTFASAQQETPALNQLILRMIDSMPDHGGYSSTPSASRILERAVKWDSNTLQIAPEKAVPSYCSGATYLVFVRTIQELIKQNKFTVKPETLRALAVKGQKDGEGMWGRWNANGPGTARAFYELKLGHNFTDWSQARPGDFLKIFWTTEIGKRERGHSVIFLGTERIDGKEYVKFWSSNRPLGYGEKSVPRDSIGYAVFSRLEHPENVSSILTIPSRDEYLANMLSVPSSPEEVQEKCGIQGETKK